MPDTWTFKDTINFLAIFLGPIVAILVSIILERLKKVKEDRFYVFRTLMATRGTVVAPDHVQALNLVQITFYDNNEKCKNVISAWKSYIDHLGNGQSKTNPNWGNESTQ